MKDQDSRVGSSEKEDVSEGQFRIYSQRPAPRGGRRSSNSDCCRPGPLSLSLNALGLLPTLPGSYLLSPTEVNGISVDM
jgi:hypothetical protein